MDTRKISIKGLIVLCLLSLLTFSSHSYPQSVDGNAVGGVVRKRAVRRGTGDPINDVRVLVVPLGSNEAKEYDKTRDKDGLYVINIPPSISKYTLLFQKPPEYYEGCLGCREGGLINNKDQDKRPDMELRSVGSEKQLSQAELREFIEDQRAMIDLGRRTGSRVLQESAKRNLELILKGNNEILQKPSIILPGRDPRNPPEQRRINDQILERRRMNEQIKDILKKP